MTDPTALERLARTCDLIATENARVRAEFDLLCAAMRDIHTKMRLVEKGMTTLRGHRKEIEDRIAAIEARL